MGGGATFGFHGLHLTTEAVAAFGELLLRRGRWRGEQLIPSGWVDPATARHVETPQFEDGSRTADWLQGMPVAVEPADGGWRVRFGTAFTVAVGHGAWRESAPLGRPVVAAGAWQAGVFVADLYVITGPHRVRRTVEAVRATATWHTVPLVGPDLLRQLRSPLMTRPDVA